MSSIRMWKPRPIRPVDGGGRMPKVSLVVASYLNEDHRRLQSLLCLLYAVRAQTYPHWEVLVVHDGPVTSASALKELDRIDRHVTGGGIRKNPQFHLLEMDERKGQFGHPYRKAGIDAATGDYVGLSNDDNYYAPVYLEWMVSELQAKQAQLALCSMVHSHRQWQGIDGRPARGSVDAGSWLADAALAKATPWTDMGFAGDWTYFNALHKKAARTVKIGSYLFVHN